MLQALRSASRDITHERRGTICYKHWLLRLVLSHTTQGVQFVTSIWFCVLFYRTRFVSGMGFASCEIAHETWGAICYGHWGSVLWALHHVISHAKQGVCFAKGICFAWVRFVTSIGFSVL